MRFISFLFCKTLIGIILVLQITSCTTTPSTKKQTWKSDNFPIKVQYQAPWSRITPSLDTKEKLISGFINQKEGTSLLINIEPDVAKEILTDEVYAQALISDIEASHKGNRFQKSEQNVPFLGYTFNKYSFQIFSGKWGPRTQEFFIYRDGENFIKVIRIYKAEPRFLKELTDLERRVSFFK